MQESGKHDRALTLALRALAEDDGRLGVSPAVEARLRAEVQSIARARRRRTQATVFAIAAALLLAVAMPAWWLAAPRPLRDVPVARGLESRSDASTAEVATEFFPLTYSNVPVTHGQIVRLEVPHAALASFGLAPIDSLDGTSVTVLADVIVGEDGLARAVRFVRPMMPVMNVPQQEQQQ